MDQLPTSTISQLGVTAVTAATAFILYRHLFAKPSRKSSFKRLRGPKPASFISGNLSQIANPDLETLRDWLQMYGMTFAIHGAMSSRKIHTADPAVVSYVLNNSMRFKKPVSLSNGIADITGPGVFVTEGETNRKQVCVIYFLKWQGQYDVLHLPLNTLYVQRKLMVSASTFRGVNLV